MSTQPMLPVVQVPRTLEYEPAGDESPPWLIGDWRAAAEAFDLKAHEVVDWHVSLAGQGRPWIIIRRIFSIAPLWGDGASPDDMRKWTWADLAAALGVSEAVLKRDLDAAVDYWKKARMSLNVQRSIEAASSGSNSDSSPPISNLQSPISTPPPSIDGLPDFQIHQQFSDEQITAILTPFRFHSIKSPGDRLYVANRILELRKLLEDKYKREQVRQLIVMEISMANYESTIHALKSRLETIQKNAEITKEQSSEVRSISDSLTTSEKALTALSTTYQKQADEIGGDEMEAGEARRVAIGTASHLVEAHRKYYATGERDLIDGMFTAEEFVWLTQPLSIRPAQYRPDIVLRMREAMEPHNLWAPDYKPSVIQREACRRMLKLVQSLAEETEPPAIDGIDDAPTESMRDDDDPADASVAIMPDPQVNHSAEYTTPASPRAEEPFMAIG